MRGRWEVVDVAPPVEGREGGRAAEWILVDLSFL